MSDDNQVNQSCGGKKKAMLAYGLIQISATVVSAISLAAIALSLCPLKQQSTTFNGCISEIIAQGCSTLQWGLSQAPSTFKEGGIYPLLFASTK